MAAFNKIILLGNLTKAPTLRTTPKGTPVCNLSLAANRKLSLNRGTRDETCFIDVAVFGAQAESAAKFLAKGRTVLIEGRFTQQTWTDPKGQPCSKHIVTAEHVKFVCAPAAKAA